MDDPAGVRRFADATGLPVIGSETLGTRAQFRGMLEAQALDRARELSEISARAAVVERQLATADQDREEMRARATEASVVLHDISWSLYEKLLAEQSGTSNPRFTYDRGELEIMVLSYEHEELNRLPDSYRLPLLRLRPPSLIGEHRPVDLFDVEAAVLHQLNALGDLHQLARGDFRVTIGTILGDSGTKSLSSRSSTFPRSSPRATRSFDFRAGSSRSPGT